MNEMLFDVLICAVTLVVIAFMRYAVPWIKSQVDESKYNEVVNIVEIAVKSAEQTIKEHGQGKFKKQEVLKFVSAWLASKHINITEEQLDRLIEATVYAMNHGGEF